MKIKNIRIRKDTQIVTPLGRIHGLLTEDSGWSAVWRYDLGCIELSRDGRDGYYYLPSRVADGWESKTKIPTGFPVAKTLADEPLEKYEPKTTKSKK